MYITVALLWILIVLYFDLYQFGIISYVLILIPLIIFVVGYINAPYITEELEENVFQASFLAIGALVLLSVFNWMREDYRGDSRYFVAVCAFSITVVLISVLDLWVKPRYLRIVRHFRDALETIATILFVFLFLIYWYGSDISAGELSKTFYNP